MIDYYLFVTYLDSIDDYIIADLLQMVIFVIDYSIYCLSYWLVVSNMFYFPFHIWDVILPIDEVHHFSEG